MKRPKKDFAKNVFDRAKMKKYLSPQAYREICKAQDFANESTCVISQKCAEDFAEGVKKWALSRGVERFTHWFQPLNNFTAGKRNSLFSVNETGDASVKFRGKELQKGEGDASSFPSGGLRQTFEARGITDWDCFSQPFIKDGCLFVPTTFKSFTGEALDKKTPLLRSLSELNRQALRLLRIIGFCCARVASVVGAEQEYFLVDKSKFLRRPDLLFCGRTLIGATPPKGQELFDHYYRPPNGKTLAFWQEVDSELWKLGIVVRTEHKEVAPNQFELAPCYAEANVACDQNQMIMQTLQSAAEKLGLVCLLNEKPFANFNGSGKHNNWSLLADKTENLFEPGETAATQARFVIFLACVVRAVDLHQDLLRFAVANAANDCRLGGFEAPPQTVSMFLGEIFDSLTAALDSDWKFGTDKLPLTFKFTDRNRTSPFAFTGNKFEFRTVGSSASLADCNTVLNTAVADSLKYFADKLQSSPNVWEDAKQLVKDTLQKHGKIVYNGNSYSPEWKKESERRGLLNVTDAYCAAKCLTDIKNVALFEECGVLTPRELTARQRIFWKTYADTVCLESEVTAVCLKQILPQMQNYLKMLLEISERKRKLKIRGIEEQQAKRVSEIIAELRKNEENLRTSAQKCKNISEINARAEFAAETLIPAMSNAREYADKAEEICPPSLWPMPTYAELLFTF